MEYKWVTMKKFGKWEIHTVEHCIWVSWREKQGNWEKHDVEYGI